MEKLKAFRYSDWDEKNWEKRKEAMRSLLLDVLGTPSETAENIRDWLKVRYLSYVATRRNTAAILFGSPGYVIDSEKSLELVLRYRDGGYFIFYDADSPLAPQIQKIVGNDGVGISANAVSEDLKNGKVLTIRNSFLRLRAFKQAERVVMGLDSIAGHGLLVNGDVNYVWDPSEQWKFWPATWDWYVTPNLGLKYKNYPKIIGKKMKVGGPWFAKKDWVGDYSE